MEATIKDISYAGGQSSPETTFSYLDKGIDDMEAGRVHTAEDAFQIIKARIKDEL